MMNWLVFSITSYVIENDNAGRNFIISVNSSVCLSHNNCMFVTDVLNKAVLPKPACNWDADFVIPG